MIGLEQEQPILEAYVTNLGKYNEGELASTLLKFPTTKEEVQAALKRIGIDNIRYEEIFIANYDADCRSSTPAWGNMKALTSSTIWPAYSPSWIGATWKSLKR